MIEQILQALKQSDHKNASRHVQIAKGLYSIPRGSKTALWQLKQARRIKE